MVFSSQKTWAGAMYFQPSAFCRPPERSTLREVPINHSKSPLDSGCAFLGFVSWAPGLSSQEAQGSLSQQLMTAGVWGTEGITRTGTEAGGHQEASLIPFYKAVKTDWCLMLKNLLFLLRDRDLGKEQAFRASWVATRGPTGLEGLVSMRRVACLEGQDVLPLTCHPVDVCSLLIVILYVCNLGLICVSLSSSNSSSPALPQAPQEVLLLPKLCGGKVFSPCSFLPFLLAPRAGFGANTA